MTAENRRGPRRPRVLAIIDPAGQTHLVAAGSPWRTASGSSSRLDLALAACLRMLEEDPPRFQRAATAWHSRWCVNLRALTLADAQVTLGALEALAGPNPTEGARELYRQAVHYGFHDVADVLERWISDREEPMPPQALETLSVQTKARYA